MGVTRKIFVVLLALYNIGLAVPDLAHLFFPAGIYGYNGGAVSATDVTSVLPHSAAADAGIQPGDRILTRYLSLHDRLFAGTGETSIVVPDRFGYSSVPHPGERVTLHVVHRGAERTVTLVARPFYFGRGEVAGTIFGYAERFIAVTLGMALVLARPGILTWTFFLWMLARGAWGISDYYDDLPAPVWIALTSPMHVLCVVALFLPALLWLYFPAQQISGWRRPVRAFVIGGIIAGAIVGLVAALIVAPLGLSSVPVDKAKYALNVLGMATQIAVIIAMWTGLRGFDRRLYFWLMLIVCYLASLEMAWTFTDLFNLPAPPDIAGMLWLGPLQTLFIAFAVLRYQMFDIEFVLSRTLVYGLFVAIAVGVFAAIDLAFTAYFHGSRIELAFDIAVALALGFGFRSVQDRIIDFVDRRLFFRRFDSRRRLKAAYAALGHANSQPGIEEIVTEEAANALGLASAAFFRKFADGGYLREFGFGWPDDAPWNLLPGDAAAAMLDSRSNSVDLRRVRLAPKNTAAVAPVLAIPMHFEGRVIAATLYSDRRDGVSSSPDEIRGLVDLSRRAADLYAYFERTGRSSVTREAASARASL
jgi:hypothetical protein